MFDLNTLILFVKVVELGSFSEAARELNTPKSTISRKISLLEEQLSIRLLQRNTRIVQLTEVGREVYAHAIRIVREAQFVTTTAESSRQEVAGNLRVMVPISFNAQTLSMLCAGFLQAYPQVDLELQYSDGDVDLLGQNFDVAIKFGPLSDSNFVARLLFERERVLVAGKEYLQQKGVPENVDALSGLDGLMLGSSRSMPVWPLGVGAQRYLVEMNPRIWVNNAASLKHLALSGLGVALLTRTDCEAELQTGALVQLLPELPIEPLRCYGLFTSRMQLAPKISHFLDYIALQVNESTFVAASHTIVNVT